MALSEVGMNEDNHSDDLDLSFGSAIDNSSDSFKKEIHYLKIFIRQKDKLIENQNFTLKAFCDQIDLLKRSTNNNNHFNQLSAQQLTSQGEKRNLVDIPESIGECPASSTKPAHSAILKNPIVSDRRKAIAVSSAPVVTTLPNCSSLPRNSRISKKDVSAAIHQANSESKCREIIQMGSKEDAGKSEGFTLVSQRKKNKLRNNPAIVGQLDLPCGSRIKYAPKMSFLHVYKMHPETIPEDLISILSPLFPEVRCEKLNSMYPNLYSSFKVTILECNVEKALNPSIWPKGTWVKKIFTGDQSRTL
ncbi:hypothetical protein JTB14_004145 [Gonioctena quinquepunctata]|nr:hypothetical protein JTB14_004145 [Gonioctena quinquepunctata]